MNDALKSAAIVFRMSSQKQQSRDKHAAPLGHITLIPDKSICLYY
jgi:hypothetical protein